MLTLYVYALAMLAAILFDVSVGFRAALWAVLFVVVLTVYLFLQLLVVGIPAAAEAMVGIYGWVAKVYDLMGLK